MCVCLVQEKILIDISFYHYFRLSGFLHFFRTFSPSSLSAAKVCMSKNNKETKNCSYSAADLQVWVMYSSSCSVVVRKKDDDGGNQ